jgi:hypothetical protein
MPRLIGFNDYVSGLEALATELQLSSAGRPHDDRISAALDGGTSAELRRVIPILERREMGAFFTPSRMAKQGAEFFDGQFPDDAVFLDVACGAGDLLIAIANLLPVEQDLGSTLTIWGQRLAGFDIEPDFIRATKARLVLTALARGARIGDTPIPTGDDLFPLIRVGDGLTQIDAIRRATFIFINPPFLRMTAPRGCCWASAKVSAAAIFIDVCVSYAQPSTQIVAILPDVLRSGSNYKRWRQHIASKATIDKVATIGQFDYWTDVDVFILRLSVRAGAGQFTNHDWWGEGVSHSSTVGDLFEIQVGRVVPYRDPERGPQYAYIYPRVLPAWDVVRSFTRRRRFSGLTFRPPFVAVRRTSRPGHEYRAVGTIISGHEDVAVENHLLVLSPNDGKVRTCRSLLDVLRAPQTNIWLNERIRCRHLTVQSVRNIPW